MRASLSDRTVLLADRHACWLDTLERTMWWLGATVVGKTTSPAEMCALIDGAGPDLLVAGDETVPGEADGASLVASARAIKPDLRIVVLSSAQDAREAPRAFMAGADVYLLKRGSREDLATAVRQLFDPTLYFAPPGSVERAAAVARATADALTPRETEILGLAAEGHSNAEVARRLWVTEQTVKFHLSNVYRKLGVANRTEASRWAQRHGLLDLPRAAEEALA